MRAIKRILIIALAVLTVCRVATRIHQGSSERKEPPVISCPAGTLEVSAADDKSVLLSGMTASDPQDGDLTDRIIIGGISRLVSNDTAKVTFLVFDSDDNMGSFVRYIRYTDYRRPQFSIAAPMVYASMEEVSLTNRLVASDVVDGDISNRIRVSSLAPTDNSEIYDITVEVTNSMADSAWLRLPVLIQPTNPLRPVITLSDYLIYLPTGSEFDPASFITAASVSQTDVDISQISINSNVDTAKADTYRVVYTYSANGVTGTAILTVVVQ